MSIGTATPLAQRFSKKLIIGFATLASAALITTIGMANANPHGDKPSKAACEQAGYENYGQCVSDWAQNNYGYGSNNSAINTNTEVDANATVVGDNNVVQFVVNVYNTINIFN